MTTHSPQNTAAERISLPIEGMTCAACAARIEKVVGRLPGVEGSVNFAAETARVRFTPGLTDPAAIVGAIAKAGFTATPIAGRDREAIEHHIEELAAIGIPLHPGALQILKDVPAGMP